MKILRGMKSFSTIEFNLGDIVRSGMVKEYLISKIKTGQEQKKVVDKVFKNVSAHEPTIKGTSQGRRSYYVYNEQTQKTFTQKV